VLFRLKERSVEKIQEAVGVLRGLEGVIPSLRGLEVGVDVVRSGRSYDIALVARFDDLEGLDAYRTHPGHVKVIEYIDGVKESVVAVDFES